MRTETKKSRPGRARTRRQGVMLVAVLGLTGFGLMIPSGTQADEATAPKKGYIEPLDMIYAARTGDLDAVGRLLNENPKLLEAKDATGATPLHLAASRGDDKLIALLLLKGADPNSRDSRKHTPCHYAAAQGQIAAIKALVAAKADVDAKNREGMTPLHLAASYGQAEAVTLLVKSGAKVKELSASGFQPIHFAVRGGHREATEALLASGAGLEAIAREETPLLMAARGGHVKVAELLIRKGAKVQKRSRRGFSALGLGIESRSQEMVAMLLKAGADPRGLHDTHGRRREAWRVAAELRQMKMAQYILREVADLNARRGRVFPPLHRCAIEDYTVLVADLLERKVAVDTKVGDKKVTPLILAAEKGHLDIVKLLILKGKAEIDEKNKDGESALYVAIRERHTEVVKFLIAQGADVDTKNEQGTSALSRCLSPNRRELARLMLKAGANIEALSTGRSRMAEALTKGDIELVRFLLDHGFKVSPNGTALHHAGTAAIARLLLAKGASVHAGHDRGTTPLHSAALYGRAGVAEVLLAAGAKVNAHALRWDKMTPLRMAATSNDANLELIEILIQHGADPWIKDRKGYFVKDVRFQANRKEAERILLAALVKMAKDDPKKHLSLFWIALERENESLLRAMLAEGVDLKQLDKDGHAILHRAWSLETAELLLEEGAKIDALAKDGTPMLFSLLRGGPGRDDESLIEFLLKKGADPNAVDKKGQTSLHVAVKNRRYAIAKLLLAHGARRDLKDHKGKTPLAYSRDFRITRLLEEKK